MPFDFTQGHVQRRMAQGYGGTSKPLPYERIFTVKEKQPMSSRKNLFDLEGKTALVTGAALGLGRSFAQTLAEAGADVVIADIDKDHLDETEGILKATGRRVL